MAESLIGRTLGQYKVMAELGQGQHSTVYKAWQPSLERYVTLKVLRHYEQQTFIDFQDEARLTAQLEQQGVPNIRRVYEVGQTADGYLFVAMEYVEDSLRSILNRAKERNQRLRPLAVTKLLEPIAEALDTIHSLGWVHLDIKPQNILIKKGGRAVLADFGIARRRGTQTHACTPVYASPEQAAGDRPVGPWSDIYSLGVVLYEMVAGHPPVRGDQDIVVLTQHLEVTPPAPRRVNPLLSAAQERAIFKALAKSPQERFRTAGEFIQAMMASETLLSSVAKTPNLNRDRSAGGRSRWVLIGIIVVLLAVLALIGWAMWPKGPAAVPTAAATSATTASTTAPTSSSAPAKPTTAFASRTPVPPTETKPPTATLAPTLTRTVRPSATPGTTPTEGLTSTPSPGP